MPLTALNRFAPARRIAPVAALLGLLAGCASVHLPASEPALVELPTAWSGQAAGPAPNASTLVDWWQRFDDPVLTRLEQQALQANTSVVGAQAALRQARALRDVADAGLSPTLGASASAQRSSVGNTAGINGGRTVSNNFQVGLDAKWELDIFGTQRSALNASEAAARASAASLGDVKVSVAAEVALAYITLRNTQARLTIARENLASQQETLQITQWRLQAGLVTALDADQARAAAEQTAAQLPQLQTSLEQTGHALAVLTGQPPAALAQLLVAPASVPQPGADIALSFPAQTLRQRADVRAAEQQVLAARSRVSQAESARWPSFSLGGSLGLNALTLGGLSSGSALAASLLGSVSVPLLDGGALRAQVRAQQAALEQSQQSYRAAVLAALKDVEDALVALQGDRQRQVSLGNAAEAAASAAQLARQRYSSGLVDFQSVLETQRTQLSTQDALAGARADVSSDLVRLYKALGGGWTPDTMTSSAATTPGGPSSESQLTRASTP